MTNSISPMIPQLSSLYERQKHPFAIGFDPSTSDLHPFLSHELSAAPRDRFLLEWYNAVADGVGSMTGAIKFQSAFFEASGIDGMHALTQIVRDAKRRGLYTILDAKRGDISSTMHAYGNAAFDVVGADALTILPWMGIDVIAALLPWMKRGHGIYTVWLSSNRSGRDIQTHTTGQGPAVAETMFCRWEEWANKEQVQNTCGYVLGATDVPAWSEQLMERRVQSLLMPGIGAQGGKITPQIKKLVHRHHATLLPISRGILRVEDQHRINTWQDYAECVRKNFLKFVEEWHNCSA